MITVSVTYNPATRMLSLDDGNYGGSTIDNDSVKIAVDGVPAGYDARLDFAVSVVDSRGVSIRPFLELDANGECVLTSAIMNATSSDKKLPFQLVLWKDDGEVINSRNTIVLTTTRAIDSQGSVEDVYTPFLMYRDTSWDWQSPFTYHKNSIVWHNGYLWRSLADDNTNNEPSNVSTYWALVGTQGPQGPPGEKVSAGDMVVRYLGDGSSTEFDVVHNLGTTKIIYSMQKGAYFVDAIVSIVDADTVHVSFKTAPMVNEITMSIYSGGMVHVADQYVHDQTVASATWNITHNRHRKVQVQVQDSAGTVIVGKVTQPSIDTVTIEFNSPTTGVAIIE